jgi:hypothetical protein
MLLYCLVLVSCCLSCHVDYLVLSSGCLVLDCGCLVLSSGYLVLSFFMSRLGLSSLLLQFILSWPLVVLCCLVVVLFFLVVAWSHFFLSCRVVVVSCFLVLSWGLSFGCLALPCGFRLLSFGCRVSCLMVVLV